MATKTWTPGLTGDWNTGTNWIGGTPSSGDVAVLATGTAQLINFVNPNNGVTLNLGTATVAGGNVTFLETESTTFGPNFRINVTGANAAAAIASTGQTVFQGVVSIDGGGTPAALLIGVGQIVNSSFANPSPTGGTVPPIRPYDGFFYNQGTIDVGPTAALLIAPTTNADSGSVFFDPGVINVNGGLLLASIGVAFGPAFNVYPNGTVNLSNHATAIFNDNGGSGANIHFADNTDVVDIGNVSFGGTYTGFQPGDTIFLTPEVGQFGTVVDYSNATLTLQPNQTLTNPSLQIATHYPGTPFVNVQLAGTFRTNDIKSAITSLGTTTGVFEITLACFVAGTRILTDRGERPIESLRPGDRVVTRDRLRPIVWVGHRRIDLAAHADPVAAMPIRIARDAFGPGAPARDLLLSPEHCVVFGGALIPIGRLVNGHSVHRVATGRVVTYYHLELDQHDVVLADGLATESWLDTGNRDLFENAPAPALRPSFPEPDAATPSCLPIRLGGEAVMAARRHLDRRDAAVKQAG